MASRFITPSTCFLNKCPLLASVWIKVTRGARPRAGDDAWVRVSVCPAGGGKGGVEGALEGCCEFARGPQSQAAETHPWVARSLADRATLLRGTLQSEGCVGLVHAPCIRALRARER